MNTNRKKRLGRGLEALLGAGADDELLEQQLDGHLASRQEASGQVAEEETGRSLVSDRTSVRVSVFDIDQNPFQPRREFNEEEISALAASLREHDILQPILVRRVEPGRFQLISGERRLRAAIKAGWTTIPARIREADDRLVAELAMVENLQRKDLNAIEKGLSFRRYLDEHRCTQEELAQRLKIDRSTIANLIRLLELPRAVQESLQRGELSAGHARALLPLGDEAQQIELARQICSDGISVRETERAVSERIHSEEVATVPFRNGSLKKNRDPNVESLERELKMVLGTGVRIKSGRRGKGTILLQFSGHDEFQRIFDLICSRGPQSKVG